MAVNEWKESGILRDDARVFPPGIAEGELEKSYPEQLQTREIPNKDILQHIIQALGHLLMTDGDNPRRKASIKIDLLSYQWYAKSITKLSDSGSSTALKKRSKRPDWSHLIRSPAKKRCRLASASLFSALAMKDQCTMSEGMLDELNVAKRCSSFVKCR